MYIISFPLMNFFSSTKMSPYFTLPVMCCHLNVIISKERLKHILIGLSWWIWIGQVYAKRKKWNCARNTETIVANIDTKNKLLLHQNIILFDFNIQIIAQNYLISSFMHTVNLVQNDVILGSDHSAVIASFGIIPYIYSSRLKIWAQTGKYFQTTWIIRLNYTFV